MAISNEESISKVEKNALTYWQIKASTTAKQAKICEAAPLPIFTSIKCT